MHTATFYSYRGGVGRTTALVNVAVDLALRGRKVLLVDFDLEAPDLPSFPLLRPEGGMHPGVVEFIDEYLRSGKPPAIANYVFAARDDVYPARLVHENGGEVWVMPAGRGDDNYWQAFHKIDWKELYDLQDGFVLFEDMKFQWQQSFQPDYVLLDARAGINDRLAICTRQLPDALVTLFTPESAGHRPPLRPGEAGVGPGSFNAGRGRRHLVPRLSPDGTSTSSSSPAKYPTWTARSRTGTTCACSMPPKLRLSPRKPPRAFFSGGCGNYSANRSQILNPKLPRVFFSTLLRPSRIRPSCSWTGTSFPALALARGISSA